jgi:predicted nucleic acid-binding Zn ribbon protein
MVKYEDSGLPLTRNCVLAVNLDMNKKTEDIIIGEAEDVRRCLNGLPHGNFLFPDGKRDLGALVMDYAPSAIGMADIRAALVSSTGRHKSPFFGQAVKSLAEHYRSGNPIYMFTALLIWQEYNRALNDKNISANLYDAIDDITLALRFHMVDEVKSWQEMDRRHPLRFLDADYRKFPVELFFDSDKDAREYAVTDRSPLAIAVYYLKRIYDSGRYIQTCPICGRAFVAKTAGMTTLCSDDCRRVQGKENKRRFDERAKSISYEKASKNEYMYWYNRMCRLRGMGLSEKGMNNAEQLFDSYKNEASRRKKDVIAKKATAADFESWLLAQRDVIDGFMDGLAK